MQARQQQHASSTPAATTAVDAPAAVPSPAGAVVQQESWKFSAHFELDSW
jgi:hypothetical protein